MKWEKEIIKLLKKSRLIKADPKWLERSQAHLLAYFKEKFLTKKMEPAFYFYLKPVLISLTVLFLIIFSTINVSARIKNSLPGDNFYLLKRTYEKIIFKLAPKENKPILRTEIAEKRLEETKKLINKVGLKDSKVPLIIKKTAEEFKKEIVSLKKEIASDKIIDEIGDLPILDDKKIVQIIVEKDLEKLLKETKEAIKEKNIVMALEKINEVEEIFSEKPVEEVKPKPTETFQEETKSEKIKPLEKPTDFKTDLLKEENSFKTDLIKE